MPMTPPAASSPDLGSRSHGDSPILQPSSWPDHPYKDRSLAEVQLDDYADLVAPCLRALVGLGYEKPKSTNQLKAMLLVLNHEHNLILLLPTGFGKSTLFQFIPKLAVDFEVDGRPRGGNSVVITPYTQLLLQHYDGSSAKGIPCFNWQDDRQGGTYQGVPTGTRLLFIQPESFISKRFIE